MKTSRDPAERDYLRIERAIRHLVERERDGERPSLAELARSAGLSEFHFQRLFRRWAGVSPKQFLSALTVERARASLERSRSVLDAALDAGVSGPGRLHDLFVELEGVSPGEYKRRGEGLEVRLGVHATRFGLALVGLSPRGLCLLHFVESRDRAVALRLLEESWPGARPRWDAAATRAALARAGLRAEAGSAGPRGPAARSGRQDALRLHVRGTAFQLRVWRALLSIPDGSVASYGALARAVGSPGASRAVGSAVGANPVAWLIPCHRVIRESGAISSYRWGEARKRAMLGREGLTRS